MEKQKSNYIVSIIVPVYNAEKYLPAAFRSVLNQTVGFENIQLVIVDDCSVDGSFAMITGYAEQYDNVVALRTPNGSGSASMPRNIGMKAADAEYIMFLDADDTLRNNAVEILLDNLKKSGADLIGAAFKNTNENAPYERRYINRRCGEYDVENDASELYEISHPIVTKLYRKSIIDANGIVFDTSLRNGEDSVFIFEYLSCCKTMWHVNDVIYDYNIHDDSISHNLTPTYFTAYASMLTSIRDKFSTPRMQKYCDRFFEESVVANLDMLCDTMAIDEGECRKILDVWYPHLKYFSEKKFNPKVPIGEILCRDAGRDDFKSYVEDFFAIRTLYKERADFLGRIFASRGWKLLTAVNKLIGRG